MVVGTWYPNYRDTQDRFFLLQKNEQPVDGVSYPIFRQISSSCRAQVVCKVMSRMAQVGMLDDLGTLIIRENQRISKMYAFIKNHGRIHHSCGDAGP